MSVQIMERATTPLPQCLRVVIPWPRFPDTTPTGKVSKAKRAGRLVPWLSLNTVAHSMHHRLYGEIVGIWREAALKASLGLPPAPAPVMVGVTLEKATAQEMDSFAVLEGAKPLIDGCVDAGLLPDDKTRYVRGGTGLAIKALSRAECQVTLLLTGVQP